MINASLVPEKSVVSAKGDGEPFDLSEAGSSVFLVTLTISQVVEQESIEVSLFTSTDGAAWEPKPVATFPQKFYVGEYPLLVDLSNTPTAKFLRAHWEVNRWGRGTLTPKFEFGVRIREVSPQALTEAKAEAKLSLRLLADSEVPAARQSNLR